MNRFVNISAFLLLLFLAGATAAQEIRQVGYLQFDAAQGVCIVGNYAYVANDVQGLRVVDISDPEHPSTVGQWDNPREAAYGVAVSGSYAYVANNDAGLFAIDVSDPTDPHQRGALDTPGLARGICYRDSLVYIADGESGLRIINVSNPRSPSQVGSLNTGSSANCVTLSGSYAFVADFNDGLRIIDISDPAHPSEVGACDTQGICFSVAISGTYAYVAEEDPPMLRVINIQNPANPHEVGSVRVPGNGMSVAVSGSYAYVAGYNCGLRVIDVTDSENPAIVGYYVQDYARSVSVSGSYAYLCSDIGLHILDCSSWNVQRANIAVDTTLTYGEVRVGWGEDRLLAIHNEGNVDLHITAMTIESEDFQRIFDQEIVIAPDSSQSVSIQFSPTHDGRVSGDLTIASNDPYDSLLTVHMSGRGLRGVCFDTPGEATNLTLENEFAYIADGVNGVQVINVGNTDSVFTVGVWDNPSEAAMSVIVNEGWAYVANNAAGLFVLDVSDPTDPHQRAAINTPGLARAIINDGVFAYVACEDGGLRIINHTDPLHPTEEGFFNPAGYIRDVKLSPTRPITYLAGGTQGNEGLRMVDVSNPAQPTEISFIQAPPWAMSVTVQDDYAYVACDDSGMTIINIADPAQPHVVGRCLAPKNAQSIVLKGDLAFVANLSDGVTVIDVSDKQNPDSIDTYYTGGMANALRIVGDKIFVADRERGLVILDAEGFLGVEEGQSTLLPNQLTLSGIYPNPFNGSTTIKFALPTSGKVTLAVYDMTGREAARLVDGELTAGYHHALWKAEGIPTGMYLIRLETAGNIQSMKAMLFK